MKDKQTFADLLNKVIEINSLPPLERAKASCKFGLKSLIPMEARLKAIINQGGPTDAKEAMLCMACIAFACNSVMVERMQAELKAETPAQSEFFSA